MASLQAVSGDRASGFAFILVSIGLTVTVMIHASVPEPLIPKQMSHVIHVVSSLITSRCTAFPLYFSPHSAVQSGPSRRNPPIAALAVLRFNLGRNSERGHLERLRRP
jgi:hypothetical protein